MNDPYFQFESPRVVFGDILRVRRTDGVLYDVHLGAVASVKPAVDCCGGSPRAVVTNVWSGAEHVTSDDYGAVKALVDAWNAKKQPTLF